MREQQLRLGLDAPGEPSPSLPTPSAAAEPATAYVPSVRDEIAAVWGLPLGERVEMALAGEQVDGVTGRLELSETPDLPWNPRQPLRLRVAGVEFSSRAIERWSVI